MHKIGLLLLIFLSGFAQAQRLTEQDWVTEEDFREVEEIVLENILWLENHPLATASNNTKELTAYVLDWLAGTPYVAVKYDEIFLAGLANSKKYKFGEKFRVTFLFGKSYYLIQNQDDPDEAKACARGVEGMVAVYNELKKVDPSVKHSMLEKYSRLSRKGKTLSFAQALLEKSLKDNL